MKKKRAKKQKPDKRLAIAQPKLDVSVMENALIGGDLSRLEPDQRLSYYRSVCQSLKLNPLTKPLEYITLNNRFTLYARKDCTDQLRAIHNISLSILNREIQDGVYVVTVRAKLASGRQDEAVGAVKIDNLTGDARANAIMKAETKAKRRVTLSISGLGFFDESELESMHGVEFDNSAEDRVNRATANRLEQRAAQSGDPATTPTPTDGVHGSAQPSTVTAENAGDVICHIGQANGQMLGRKVSDLSMQILKWIDGNYTVKWAKQVVSKQDERLKIAVEHELRKRAKTSEADAGKQESAQSESTQQPQQQDASKAKIETVTGRDALIAKVREKSEALQLSEAQLVDLLRNEGLADKKVSRLIEISTEMLLLILQNKHWQTIEALAPSFK